MTSTMRELPSVSFVNVFTILSHTALQTKLSGHLSAITLLAAPKQEANDLTLSDCLTADMTLS